MNSAQEIIKNSILKLEGVSAHPHRFGGIEFKLGKRELGHIHGNKLVDIPFPKKVKDELIKEGKAKAHHVLPESGWISFYIKSDEDIYRAIELLKKSYSLAVNKFGIKH
ncbi:MAG TPA: luciferase family protein [Ignavibacteria bacterium]|jgi:hypothetical protein